MHDWRHYYKVFPYAVLKWRKAVSFRKWYKIIFPAFSSKFVDFAVEFYFRSRFSSLGKRLDGVIFLDQSHFFATNSSQSWDCFILFRRYIIPNGYFRFRQSGQMPAFELCWKILKQKKRFICISLFVIATNRFHVVVHLFSNWSQMTFKCGKNKTAALKVIVCRSSLIVKSFFV